MMAETETLDPPELDESGLQTDDVQQDGEVPDGQLGDWREKFPQAVVVAADEYDEASTAATKAKRDKEAKAARVKELLHEHDLAYVVFREGKKRLSLTVSETLNIKNTEAGDLSANPAE